MEWNERSIVVVCGWCPDVREKTAAAAATGALVSHGMCPNCTHRMEALADDRAGMRAFDYTSHSLSSVAPAQRVIE